MTTQYLLPGGIGVRMRELSVDEFDQNAEEAMIQCLQADPNSSVIKVTKLEHKMGVMRSLVAVTKKRGLTVDDLAGADWYEFLPLDLQGAGDFSYGKLFGAKAHSALVRIFMDLHCVSPGELDSITKKAVQVAD
jgi:hypothetical protein